MQQVMEALANGGDLSGHGKPKQAHGSRYLRRVKMTPEQWYGVPINPVQRDTELHAKRATHLRAYSPDHALVKMAVLPTGARFKLDGHTRAYLWERGETVPPAELFVDVYECDAVEDAIALYTHFDSRLAVETAVDMVTGAARRAGLKFESGMLRQGRFGSAVKELYLFAHRAWNGSKWGTADFTYEAVNAYAAELRLLDTVGPVPPRFPRGILMAALATLKRRGQDGVEFWRLYAGDAGKKDGETCDGVQALSDVVSSARRVTGRGTSFQAVLFTKAVTAFEGFRRHERYTVGSGGGVRNMKAENLRRYVRAHLVSGDDE